jgi:ElaB/YqjD/DUF883 family membrane-anchored ribosome-binding protein
VFGGALTALAARATMILDRLVAKAVSRPESATADAPGAFPSLQTMTGGAPPFHAAGDCREENLMNDFKGIVGSADALLTDVAHSATESLVNARSAVEDTMSEARSKLLYARRRVSGQVRQTADATDHYVRAHPWEVLAGAAVVGFVAGFLLNRR